MSRHFRPRPGPTIITLVLLVILVVLGGWQVQRLAWKTALVAQVKERMSTQPAPLPEKIDNTESWEYRRVTMAGQYLYDHEFLVKSRTLDGQAGYHMLVPFRRASGGIVFVNRGWISDDLMQKAARPKGLVPVEGIAQVPRKSRFTPANAPDKKDWYWADVPAMAAAAGLKDVAPVVVSVAAREKNVYPAGGQVRLDIPNDHRKYAFFWFGMAFVLLAIWGVSSCTENT